MRPRFAATALALAAALLAPAFSASAQQTASPVACARVDTALGGSDSTAARRAAPSVVQRGAARDSSHVTLRILASATADEVRFVGSPRICVRLTGDAQVDSVRVLARRNIASPVVSGTTYRNVYVAVEILGRLNAECIAGRITGSAPDSTTATRCASLGAGARAGSGPP
ncbi:MAG: hypothetical protein JWN79_1438 [Gemmatimonadetes bacterium]|nr:hypothetical protein [Gemmatimonadota bacterium]